MHLNISCANLWPLFQGENEDWNLWLLLLTWFNFNPNNDK